MALPRRDLVLLPLVAVVTLLLLGAFCEGAARLFWPEQQTDACMVHDASGARFRANCRSEVKPAEAGWVEYAYNGCGYRTAAPCGAKPEGALRVAVLGTSISRGYWVPYAETFAGRAEAALTRACGRPVEFQNLSLAAAEGRDGPLWHTIADRTGAALALQPDAIMTVIAPFDLEGYTAPPDTLPGARNVAPPPPGLRDALPRWFRSHVTEASRAVLVAQHLFYLDPVRYVPFYLKHGDAADYLRPPFRSAWRMRLAIADQTIGRIAAQARAAQVKLVVVFMPARPQALLVAEGDRRPGGTDPFAFGVALGATARRHGAIFVDLTEAMRGLSPRAADFYLPVDAHPTGRAHALIAEGVERALLADVPAFAPCRGGADGLAATR